MVLAQYRVITEKLGVNHLRLVMGTSMGAMHTWVWGETYPDFMDAIIPISGAALWTTQGFATHVLNRGGRGVLGPLDR